MLFSPKKRLNPFRYSLLIFFPYHHLPFDFDMLLGLNFSLPANAQYQEYKESTF